MLEQPLDLYLTFAIEPEMDVAEPARLASALGGAQLLAIATHTSPWLLEHADILLPAAAYAETSGTYVNIEGNAQSFRGVAAPPGESRPGWKILRVLGNLVGLDGFDYAESTTVRDEVLAACADLAPDNRIGGLQDRTPRSAPGEWERVGGVPIYAVDALSRRAHALQLTPDAWGGELRLNAAAAAALDLGEAAAVRVSQGEGSAEFEVRIDDAVLDGCIWLPTAVPGSEALGAAFGPVRVEKA
jgi:NADH-quinone oxidoreductase subunit G